jgi:hypothetical protein
VCEPSLSGVIGFSPDHSGVAGAQRRPRIFCKAGILNPKTEIEPLIALIKTDYEDFLKVSFLPKR